MRLAALLLAFLLLGAAPARAADPRVPVDPNAVPWRAVAKVQTNIGTRCTGVLIAPDVVLTAAHCLYNLRTRVLLQPASLHVLFGYEWNSYRSHRFVARYTVGAGFEPALRQPQGADWARLYLAENVPVPPLPIFEGRVAAGLPVMLAGYNQDHGQLLMADLACRVSRVAVLPDGSSFLIHDCAGTRGTSGAPLLARQNGRWAVVAINEAVSRQANLALRPPVVRSAEFAGAREALRHAVAGAAARPAP